VLRRAGAASSLRSVLTFAAFADVWDELVIVTTPDQRIGRRGSELSVSPLKILAERLKGTRLEFIPHSKPEFRKWDLPTPFTLPRSETDAPSPPARHVLVTASFGRILTKRHLSNFLPSRRLNVHPSLLPRYRGPAPIQHAIMNGDTETGVCILEMLPAVGSKRPPQDGAPNQTRKSSSIDAGDIWASTIVEQPATADFAHMRDVLAVQGGKLLVDTLRKMRDGVAPPPVMQAGGESREGLRTAPMISLEDGLVSPTTQTAAEIERRYRAIAHQRPLYVPFKQPGRPIQLHGVRAVSPSETSIDRVVPATPGSTVCLLDAAAPNDGCKTARMCLYVRCKGGSILAVPKVKPEGKLVCPAGDFWNGIKTKQSDGSIVLGAAS